MAEENTIKPNSTTQRALGDATCSSVWLVITGIVYEGGDPVEAYDNEQSAKKRATEIEKEQEDWRKALADDSEEYHTRSWSPYATYDYAEVHDLKILR